MRYQTIQRYKTNFEILKPATVIAEEWKNLDRTQKDRLAIGGPKALVLVSKSSTPTKHRDTGQLHQLLLIRKIIIGLLLEDNLLLLIQKHLVRSFFFF